MKSVISLQNPVKSHENRRKERKNQRKLNIIRNFCTDAELFRVKGWGIVR